MNGAAGFPTHVRTFGSGDRPALAIHCTLAHSGAWAGVAKVLGEHLTLTAYDLPGHGKSGDWTGEGDLHQVSTDMGRALLTQPMDLVGHSFGATVALRLAVENPARVRSLTMIEPVFFAPALADEPERVQAHDDLVADYEKGLADGDMESAARGFNRVWGDGTKWADIPKSVRDYMIARIRIVPDGTPMLFEDNAKLLVPGALDRVTMPSLLIEGEASIDVVDAINGALARRLPDARRMVIEGAGHMAPITHPEAVGAAIHALLEVS